MSRIGNKPIALPSGVQVTVNGDQVTVKGPKGQLSRSVVEGISLDVSSDELTVNRASDSQQHRASHGLMRSLLSNMVEGVTSGYDKELEIVGVGYRVETRGQAIELNLGFSHPIHYPFPDGISIAVEGQNKLKVQGIDKEKVGQVAAELRSFRPPDSYKGKGVRYLGERVRLKAGKSGQ